MKAFHFDPEQYTNAIDNATIKAAARLTNEYMLGRVETVELIIDSVHLKLDDDHVLADLVRNTIAGMSNIGRLVADVIQAEAERIALEEVEAQARSNYDAYVDDQVDQLLEQAA
jgi:hypothetical protein